MCSINILSSYFFSLLQSNLTQTYPCDTFIPTYELLWHFRNASDELAELLDVSIYTASSVWQMQTLRFLCSLYGIRASVCCQKLENGHGLWPTKNLMLPTHICRAVTWENDNTQWLRLFPLPVTVSDTDSSWQVSAHFIWGGTFVWIYLWALPDTACSE